MAECRRCGRECDYEYCFGCEQEIKRQKEQNRLLERQNELLEEQNCRAEEERRRAEKKIQNDMVREKYYRLAEDLLPVYLDSTPEKKVALIMNLIANCKKSGERSIRKEAEVRVALGLLAEDYAEDENVRRAFTSSQNNKILSVLAELNYMAYRGLGEPPESLAEITAAILCTEFTRKSISQKKQMALSLLRYDNEYYMPIRFGIFLIGLVLDSMGNMDKKFTADVQKAVELLSDDDLYYSGDSTYELIVKKEFCRRFYYRIDSDKIFMSIVELFASIGMYCIGLFVGMSDHIFFKALWICPGILSIIHFIRFCIRYFSTDEEPSVYKNLKSLDIKGKLPVDVLDRLVFEAGHAFEKAIYEYVTDENYREINLDTIMRFTEIHDDFVEKVKRLGDQLDSIIKKNQDNVDTTPAAEEPPKSEQFKIYCPHCNQKYVVESDWAGMEATCDNCSNSFTIPRLK